MARLINLEPADRTAFGPPGTSLSEILLARLSDDVPVEGGDLSPPGSSFAHRTIDALLCQAISGDVNAIRLIFDRIDGPLSVRLSGRL